MYYIINIFTRKIPFSQSFSSSSNLLNKNILNNSQKHVFWVKIYTRGMSLKMLKTNPLLAKNPIHQFKFITNNNGIIDFDNICVKNK